ncbi:hypothetical protein MKEN_00121500 [Mycena kentingensis (nom. inval.)]|nr:hypothetical protein MKEN_00121500 [Mycena kentingensis (nom. inval.)]
MALFIALLAGLSAPTIATLVKSRDANAYWTLQGCYTDTSSARTLAAASFTASNMTVESCLAFCSSGGYNLAGVEFGSECYCDHAIQSTGTVSADADCDMPCNGAAAETCGAADFMNLYWNGEPFPVAPATVGTWQYKGCFGDNINSRALPHQLTISSGVTIESCTAACKANGYTVAGVEFGRECWCSFQLPTTSLLADAACQTACIANTAEFCGGSSKLTVYADTTSTQTCVSNTRLTAFNLQALFVTPPASGPASLPLHILIVNTVPMTSYDILTAGGSTFTSEVLTNGGILGSLAGQPQLRAASIAVIAGDSPTFITQQFLPTSPNAYCIMNDPAFGEVLAVNGHSDLWSLCPNSSASGRQDIVFSAKAGHPHYNLTNCQSVYITFTS